MSQRKHILFKKEQSEIADKIIDILKLDKYHSIILYDLDNDEEKIDAIMNLTSDIKKFFVGCRITGIADKNRTKRSYLSIIKNILKNKFEIVRKNCRLYIVEGKNDRTVIRTQRYSFMPKSS